MKEPHEPTEESGTPKSPYDQERIDKLLEKLKTFTVAEADVPSIPRELSEDFFPLELEFQSKLAKDAKTDFWRVIRQVRIAVIQLIQ